MRRATTLVELLVVLAVMGIALAAVPMLLRNPPAPESDWRMRVADARRRAVATGVPVSAFTDSTGRFTAYPEGMVIADSVRAERAR